MQTRKPHPLFAPLALALGLALVVPSLAEARDFEDCQLMWGQAVRSYLTKNRTKGPEDEAFKAACEIEQTNDLDRARIEAITVGVKALASLDLKGCTSFLKTYVGATLPGKVCEAARSEPIESLRKLVEGSLPPAPKRRPR